ncbi:MAG: von Willebrand factor type A domain-containing protein [Clostridiales bacterium]|nr:von Willebrand factor type A domain-containing protein [Clostridiales bacterium]
MKKARILAAMLIAVLLTAMVLPALAETILKKGDTGADVTKLQERLIQLGYLEGEATGEFDDETEAALMAFQRRDGLLATGMADRITWDALFSETAPAKIIAGKNTFSDWDVDGGAYYEESGAVYESFANAFASIFPGMLGTSAPADAGMIEEDFWNTNEYTYIRENGFQSVSTSPLSTFAADVDTASYAQLRSLILASKKVPGDAVRIEEMLNYFQYDYPQPEGDCPFGVFMELAPCPWNEDTLLLQVGLQAKTVMEADRPQHNLVFLIDVSGSMFGEDRLDLVKRAFLMLLDELKPTDTVSIITYASRDQVVLSGVPAADKVRIMEAISSLEAGGSTNSASGIQTAYQLAEMYAVPGGVNRILMATDGDFNVGMTSEGDLARLVMEKKQSGVRLTMLGVGYGNYKDNKLEALADYGDGNYYYLDSIFEARRALVTEAGGTFMEVAKDVKLQLDFNPALVQAYRLIGYEDRIMAAEDFADDTKDGGEIGSGHRVTALYEIVPVGSAFQVDAPQSKYQQPKAQDETGEWLTLNIRAKKPDAQESELWSYPLTGAPQEELSDQMKFAAAVAETGMLLRGSEFAGSATYTSALQLARTSGLVTGDPYKEEFVYLLTLLERNDLF